MIRYRRDTLYERSWLVYKGDRLLGRVTREEHWWVARLPTWRTISKIGVQVDGKLVPFATRKEATAWLLS